MDLTVYIRRFKLHGEFDSGIVHTKSLLKILFQISRNHKYIIERVVKKNTENP